MEGDSRAACSRWRSSRWRSACRVPGRRRTARRRTRWPGSTSGRTTTAAGRRRTTTAGSTSRRCSAARFRRPTRRTSRPGAQFDQTVQSLQNQGYQMIFATSYGMVTKAGRGEVPEHQVRAGDGHRRRAEPVRVLRCRRGHGLPVGDGGRRGVEERQHRLRRRVPDPGGHPARERVHARRAARASGRQGAPRVDELVVRPGEGEEGRPEPRLAGRRRARPERRLAGDRPVRRVAEHQVGRLRLRRVEVRAEGVADGLRLQLGAVLPEAGQGGDGRHLEDGLLLRLDQRRLHEAGARSARA